MTPFEAMSLAKLFYQIMGGGMTPAKAELETASKMLKELGDNSPNWNPMQKEMYKVMVDAAKELSERRYHG